MALVPNLITPRMYPDAALYRGRALSQLRILKQQLALGGLKMGTRTVELEPGVVAVCQINFDYEIADIFFVNENGELTTTTSTTTTSSTTTTTTSGSSSTTTSSTSSTTTTTTSGETTTTTTVDSGNPAYHHLFWYSRSENQPGEEFDYWGYTSITPCNWGMYTDESVPSGGCYWDGTNWWMQSLLSRDRRTGDVIEQWRWGIIIHDAPTAVLRPQYTTTTTAAP